MDCILDKIWKARHPKDVLFFELFEGFQTKYMDNFTELIFFVKDDKYFAKYHLISDSICVSDNSFFFEKFTSEFNIKYYDVSNIIIKMIQTHIFHRTTGVYSMNLDIEELEVDLKYKGVLIRVPYIHYQFS